MNDHKYQIFKAQDVECFTAGWIVDLSPDSYVNPDFYYRFRTLKNAKKFRDLVESGMSARAATHEVSG